MLCIISVTLVFGIKQLLMFSKIENTMLVRAVLLCNGSEKRSFFCIKLLTGNRGTACKGGRGSIFLAAFMFDEFRQASICHLVLNDTDLYSYSVNILITPLLSCND